MNTTMSDDASGTPQSSRLSLPMVPRVSGTVKWHLLTIAAGCVLTAMFFLPLDSLRNWSSSSETPVKGVVEVSGHVVESASHSLPGALLLSTYVFSVAVLPHIWGLLMVLYSLGSLLEPGRLRIVPHASGVLIGVLLAAAATTGMVGSLPQVLKEFKGSGTQYYLALLVIGITSLVSVLGVLYALLAIRRGRWAYLYHGFAGAGVLVFVFTVMNVVMVLAFDRRYVGLTGLTVTWLVSCLLFFSRVGEARVVTGLTWRRTLWYLLTLRLHKAPRPVGLCPGCGYNLYGLREQRCPECGRPFTFEEVLSTPQSLGFAGGSMPGSA